MGEIDRPGAKLVLWQKMREDLVSLVPWFADNDLLLCPTCCRPLEFDAFSLEHIIPQQAVSEDPAEVRAAIVRNERSGLTLLCQAPLYSKGRLAHPLGCNSWKGKFYDSHFRQALRGPVNKFNQRHLIALLSAGYLGLVQRFGYQAALVSSGLLMRRQFFSPGIWLKEMPKSAQMILRGEGPETYDEDTRDYWSVPFKFVVEGESIIMIVRNVSMRLPISRDPTLPLARVLPYAPGRYKLRPDVSTVFD